jgi:glycosyltransferase involved in cell wall biosynthesis
LIARQGNPDIQGGDESIERGARQGDIMRVLVSLEDRYFKHGDGRIYSNTTCDYPFWRRYLQVFDEVVVLARVCAVDQKPDKPQANGPGVSFYELPYYVGPVDYLRTYRKLNTAIQQSIDMADAYILRIPGAISTRLWHYLRKRGLPYGVEVIGDSRDSLRTAGGNRLLRGVLSVIAPRNQRRQCQSAVAASYVSEFYLQKHYPPGCWSTHYSTLDLPDEAILEGPGLEQKTIRLREVADGTRPLRICHAGTMEVAYKAQDILLEAVAILGAKGLEVELSLMGDGRLAGHYVDTARQLGIQDHVRFLGMLPPGEVRKQLDLADLFVLPSTTEGLPRIVIEAMARALPCIATNVGGIPELLDEADMVPPANAGALAGKIESVVRDIYRMETMSRRNLSAAQKYSMHELNTRRIEFYRTLIAGTPSRP